MATNPEISGQQNLLEQPPLASEVVPVEQVEPVYVDLRKRAHGLDNVIRELNHHRQNFGFAKAGEPGSRYRPKLEAQYGPKTDQVIQMGVDGANRAMGRARVEFMQTTGFDKLTPEQQTELDSMNFGPEADFQAFRRRYFDDTTPNRAEKLKDLKKNLEIASGKRTKDS